MKRPNTAAVLHGAIGGLIAGAVVAIWFFVLDLVGGQALRTPLALASAVLDSDAVGATFRLVSTYTLLHFGVFALLGAATGLILNGLDVEPGILLGLVFGLGVLDAIHYGALLVTGTEMLAVLPGVHVIAANVLGGIVLMTYLHYALESEEPLGLAVLRDRETLAEGMVAGLVGAAAVALWFLVLDVITGTAFFTPAALGSLVFMGADSAAEVRMTLGMVAAYTVLHTAVFLAIGIALQWVAERIERTPSMWLMAAMAFIMLEGLFLITLVGLGEWILGALSWWAVGLGNLIAVGAMGLWIWRKRPELRRQLGSMPAETRI